MDKKLKTTRPETTWYVEPIGEVSNNSISEFLQTANDDYCWEVKVIVNRKERTANLIRCPNYNSIALMEESKSKYNGLNFRIFAKVGSSGKIRQKPYLKNLNKYKLAKTKQEIAKTVASRQ